MVCSGMTGARTGLVDADGRVRIDAAIGTGGKSPPVGVGKCKGAVLAGYSLCPVAIGDALIIRAIDVRAPFLIPGIVDGETINSSVRGLGSISIGPDARDNHRVFALVHKG